MKFFTEFAILFAKFKVPKFTLIFGLRCTCRDPTAENWLVLTSAHDLLSVESTRLAHSVSHVLLHQDFNLDTFDSDIALIRLNSPVSWGPAVSPVCLPPPDYDVPPGTQCVITGWGVAGNCTNNISPLLISRSICCIVNDVTYSGPVIMKFEEV